MTRFGFYAPSMAWLAVLIVPLVLFYFLKLKRPRLTITSLVLWQQVINDSRVNSPFQRFKRNLLLLLQLILLALLIAAATQPYWRGRVSRIHRLPVLIDCSASMAALDKKDGVSRLDAAREKVREIIDGLLADQELCLISFSRTARRSSPFTGNRKVLLDALREIEVEDVASDVEDALRMTQSLESTTTFGEVLLLSDGNFPTEADFELSFALNYQKLPPAGRNLGITSLNARRTPDGMWDVFVRVEGSAEAEGAATVEVTRDGQPIGREDVVVGKGESERIVFRVAGDRPSSVEVRLLPDGFDSLASDNRALLDLPALRQLWVYVPTSLGSFRHALRPLAGIRLFPEEDNTTTRETDFDLVITDRAEDKGLSGRTALYVGMVPDEAAALVTVGRQGTAVVDWRRNCALLQHVELRDLVLLDDPRSNEGVRESDYENLGFEVLIHGTAGPLLFEKRRGETLSYHMLFHTDRSTLPYRVGFPVLVSNLVQLACHQAGLTEVRANATGVLPPISVRPDTTYEVTGPGDVRRTETSDRTGKLRGIPAPRVGVYSVRAGGTEETSMGASLLSSKETALAGVEEIQFNEDLSVSAAGTSPRMDRSLWPVIALVAFCVLLAEWLYYHRSAAWFAK